MACSFHTAFSFCVCRRVILLQVYTHTRTRTHIHTHAHTHTHTFFHVHIYTHLSSVFHAHIWQHCFICPSKNIRSTQAPLHRPSQIHTGHTHSLGVSVFVCVCVCVCVHTCFVTSTHSLTALDARLSGRHTLSLTPLHEPTLVQILFVFLQTFYLPCVTQTPSRVPFLYGSTG